MKTISGTIADGIEVTKDGITTYYPTTGGAYRGDVQIAGTCSVLYRNIVYKLKKEGFFKDIDVYAELLKANVYGVYATNNQ